MKLRCLVDGLLLDAVVQGHPPALIAFDGDEPFLMEAVEALYYEVVSATSEELLRVEQASLRLLHRADDFAASSAE